MNLFFHSSIILCCTGCEWISERRRPDLPEFQMECQNSIVIFEFFTHCCINCVHSIEELRQVFSALKANRLKNGKGTSCDIKIISVHSPKFTREKDFKSIQNFVRRMKMDHSDVFNDPNCTLWSNLGISCWPTLLVFGPNPSPVTKSPEFDLNLNLLYAIMGEGHGKDLQFLLQTSLDYFDKTLQFRILDKIAGGDNVEISRALEEETPQNNLKYPGIVVVDSFIFPL